MRNLKNKNGLTENPKKNQANGETNKIAYSVIITNQ